MIYSQRFATIPLDLGVLMDSKKKWLKIREVDACDFLLGIDAGLVEHVGRGLYRAPRSGASMQFFSSGLKKKSPRTITLWIEAIITIAVLARLHFELCWPPHLLGVESKDLAFDAMAYLSKDSDVEYIACEVKKSDAEIEQLIDLMKRFGACRPTDEKRAPREQNAYKKLQALRSRRPPLFWAVGPGCSGHAFKMGYREDGLMNFEEITIQELRYPS
jgi:hypothetical protein